MARSQYYTNPADKHLEVFLSFPGGLNTMTAEDNLDDRELPGLVNRELTLRGSSKRRHGMVQQLAGTTAAGKGQGYFRFYKTDGTFDEIQAVGGILYVGGVEKATGLQATRPMEAVQFGDKLYIATGSGLFSWDGAVMAKVTAYKPQPLEALYVGTNALADDPTNYLQDGTSSSVVSILGTTIDKRYGVVNQPTTITVYVNKPAGATVEYKFERKLIVEPYDKWTVDRDWGTDKTYSFSTDKAGEYEIRVSARRQGQTVVDSFWSIPKYVIKPTADPNDAPIPHETIEDCNRILLHWNRLIMYGDPTQPDVIYISHLNNPAYFPTPHSLRFTNPKREGLTSLVRFRDIIVAFTKTSVQALYGKAPNGQDAYRRVTLNTAVGCIAPDTAKVYDNYIAFLSYEGVYVLKSLGYSEELANVKVVSEKVADEIHADENAVAEVHGNQYHITFPDRGKRMRYYYERDVWAKDESTKFNFAKMAKYDGELYALSNEYGVVYRFDETKFTDDGYVYPDYIETKFLTFNQPFNRKKIREMHILTGVVENPTTVSLDFYTDNVLALTKDVVLQPTTGITQQINGSVSDRHEIKVAGKGRAIKVVVRHSEANELHLLGLAFVFKLKKP